MARESPSTETTGEGATSDAGVDLRPRLPSVGDQGRRNTCVAFAVTAAHEDFRSQRDDLSEEGLYWGCKRLDGVSAPGTTFPAAGQALSRWGQPLQELWPYDHALSDTDPLPSPPGGDPAPGTWYTARLEQTDCTGGAVKSQLDAGTVVVLGIRVSRDFHVSRDGRIPMPASARRLAGLHAILAVGYTEDELIFRNSWGERWGDGGYGYLPIPYLDQYGLQAWTVDAPYRERTVSQDLRSSPRKCPAGACKPMRARHQVS